MHLTKIALASTLSVALLSAPAFAASLASGAVEFSLERIGTLPGDVFETVDNALSGGDQSAAGFASADFAATGDDLSGEISSSADVLGDGNASGDAFYNVSLGLDTTSFDIIPVEYSLTYSLSGTTMVDDDVMEDAMTVNTLDLFVDGNSIFSERLELGATDGASPVTGTFSFFVDLDGFADIEIFAETASFAESALAPVPVPASGLLLIGGVAGLVAMRRRKG